MWTVFTKDQGKFKKEFSNFLMILANESIKDYIPFVVSFFNMKDDIIVDIKLWCLFIIVNNLIIFTPFIIVDNLMQSILLYTWYTYYHFMLCEVISYLYNIILKIFRSSFFNNINQFWMLPMSNNIIYFTTF